MFVKSVQSAVRASARSLIIWNSVSPVVIRKNKRRPISWPASRSGFQSVLMMQPAQQRLRDDSKADRQAMIVCLLASRLALRIWDARSQARMRASVVVMSDPLHEYPTDVPLIQRNHPIQTLATNRADQPFAIRIRLRGSHGRLENRQTHGPHGGIDALGIDAVAVVNEPSMGLIA